MKKQYVKPVMTVVVMKKLQLLSGSSRTLYMYNTKTLDNENSVW